MSEPKTYEEALAVIAEKDRIIEQKNQDIVGIRKTTEVQMRKLQELSDEEKATLSQKEIELHEAALDLQQRQEAFEMEQREHQKAQREATINKVIKDYVGDNADLAKKMRENFDAFKDSENAFTEDKVSALAEKSFNLLGNDKPENPVAHNISGDGGRAPVDGGEKKDYSETPEGKGLANMLGLSQTSEPAPADPTPPAPQN